MASEGIFYVIREPHAWKIVSRSHEDGNQLAHVDVWEREIVSELAREWAKKARLDAANVSRQIVNYPYAFPRGRVVKTGSRFVVFHGNDLTAKMKITRLMIEKCFGIQGRAKWQADDHERCQHDDKETVRQLLKIRDDWDAVK